MEYVYIGKIVNTHGIKGEVRILSNFEFKEKVFKSDVNYYIGEEKICEKIVSYRHHKNFEMVKFEGIDDINDVIKYKGKKVYFLKSDLELKTGEILESDLIGLNCFFENESIGEIVSIENYNGNKVLYLDNNVLIPYNSNFILNIDIDNKSIEFKNIEGLLK